ncbi:MAG: hypothetical protein ACK42G_00215 [Candidatus Kapaibacteriota bacterium]
MSNYAAIVKVGTYSARIAISTTNVLSLRLACCKELHSKNLTTNE